MYDPVLVVVVCDGALYPMIDYKADLLVATIRQNEFTDESIIGLVEKQQYIFADVLPGPSDECDHTCRHLIKNGCAIYTVGKPTVVH